MASSRPSGLSESQLHPLSYVADPPPLTQHRACQVSGLWGRLWLGGRYVIQQTCKGCQPSGMESNYLSEGPNERETSERLLSCAVGHWWGSIDQFI